MHVRGSYHCQSSAAAFLPIVLELPLTRTVLTVPDEVDEGRIYQTLLLLHCRQHDSIT